MSSICPRFPRGVSVDSGLDGDREAMAEIMAEFLVGAPDQVARLNDALQAGDALEVRQQAHALKGSAANVGARALSQTAARVERGGMLEGVPDLARDLEENLDRLMHLLRSEEMSSESADCRG